MERGDRGVRVAVRDELVDADRHLLGRLVGERQGEDLRRTGTAGGNQPGDAAGDDLRLARPGAGHDQQRTLAVRHRPELIRVEAAEQRVEADRILRRGGVHDRHEVAPGRELVERWRLAPDPGSCHRGIGGHVRSIRGRRAT